jgi:hypothetical protein
MPGLAPPLLFFATAAAALVLVCAALHVDESAVVAVVAEPLTILTTRYRCSSSSSGDDDDLFVTGVVLDLNTSASFRLLLSSTNPKSPTPQTVIYLQGLAWCSLTLTPSCFRPTGDHRRWWWMHHHLLHPLGFG